MVRRAFLTAMVLGLIAPPSASKETPSTVVRQAVAFEGTPGGTVDDGSLRRLICLAVDADGKLNEVQVGQPFALENPITGDVRIHVEGITWSVTGVVLPDRKAEVKWDVIESKRNRRLPATVDELKLGAGTRTLKLGEKVTIPLLGSAAGQRWIEVRAVESRDIDSR